MTDQPHAQPRALHDAANVAHLTTTELTRRLCRLADDSFFADDHYLEGARHAVAILFGDTVLVVFDGMLDAANDAEHGGDR